MSPQVKPTRGSANGMVFTTRFAGPVSLVELGRAQDSIRLEVAER
jgi:hypothetical protein